MSSDLKYEKLLEEFCKDFRNDSGMTGNECECLRRIERLLTHIKNDNRRKLIDELEYIKGDIDKDKCSENCSCR